QKSASFASTSLRETIACWRGWLLCCEVWKETRELGSCATPSSLFLECELPVVLQLEVFLISSSFAKLNRRPVHWPGTPNCSRRSCVCAKRVIAVRVACRILATCALRTHPRSLRATRTF
ncbi:unnamed protein product, partial [Ixodes persulcatus]